MNGTPNLARRELVRGGLAASALSVFGVDLTALGFGEPAAGDRDIPFLDPQPINPERPMIHWPDLDSWITPDESFFSVSHYGVPEAVDPAAWSLNIEGLVERPISLSLEQIKSRPRIEHIATLECSGNGMGPGFMGAIGNARWTGAALGPILRACGLKDEAKEVVFFGTDESVEEIRKQEFKQTFARSLSLTDALNPNVLLAYEMNGKPLSPKHGAPLRLIVPGWYGVAWVKWLNRIELHDRRFMGKFMARDYVTIRGEQRGGRTIWRETSVGPMRIKSIIARVVQRADRTLEVFGAAWNDGVPIETVQVKVDDGAWIAADLQKTPSAKYAWVFWSHTLKDIGPGEHALVSRAIDVAGRIQPAAEDPEIALKKTYWEANQQVVRRIRI